MLTDPARLRKTDPGNPDICNLYPYHELLTAAETRAEIRRGCTDAGMGCVECKGILLKGLEAFLTPLHERRAKVEAKPGMVWEVLKAGREKALRETGLTMQAVREAMHLGYNG
jgi:tryptophanyl-tRNA synthetase